MGIRIILISFGLDLHRMLPASQQFAKLSCDGQILPPSIEPLSIEFLVDIIFFDGHRPTGNLPVARRPSPSLWTMIGMDCSVWKNIIRKTVKFYRSFSDHARLRRRPDLPTWSPPTSHQCSLQPPEKMNKIRNLYCLSKMVFSYTQAKW